MLNNIQNGWRRLTTRVVLIIGIVYFICVSNFPAIAETVLIDSKWQCTSTSELKTSLEANGEQIAFAGKVGDNELIFTLWSSKKGDWSVVATPVSQPDISCMVIFGTGFRDMKPKMTI